MNEMNDLDRASEHAMQRQAYLGQQVSELNSLLEKLTDVTKVVKETELLLKGMKEDEDGNIIIDPEAEPLCNATGATRMTQYMKSMVSPIVLMSNFEEDQIRRMVEEISLDILEDLLFNRKVYGIKTRKAISLISDLVSNNGFACAMSAFQNGTRKMLKSTIIETHLSTPQGNANTGKKQGGLMSLFNLGRK